MNLKQFVAFFVLVIFMAQTFSNAIIVADYYINKASFSAHCENKGNPQLHCDGQCQMVKQMEREDSGSNPFSNSSKEKNELQVFCKEENNINVNLTPSFSKSKNHIVLFSKQQYINTPFHPPCQA